jgi:NADPH:quinone reductase-like Zn-dependent oxidoreductase
MRAISQDVAGGPEVLHLVDLPRPVPGPTEVLVRVHAAGVNPTDAKTRARGKFPIGVPPPFVLGFDVCGTVEEVGEGATLYDPGTRVFGMPRFPYPASAYAEFVTAPSRHFARVPDELDDVHAAALPLAGLTAWQALVDTAGTNPGQRVLIHAAAGGVGHLAVQIAKARGAHVIATATAAKHPLLRELGADETLDYRSADFAQAVSSVDVVLDPVGEKPRSDHSRSSTPAACWSGCRPGRTRICRPAAMQTRSVFAQCGCSSSQTSEHSRRWRDWSRKTSCTSKSIASLP